MRNSWVAFVCAALIGCGNSGADKGGSDASMNPGGPDAKQFRDAPPTMTAQITVSGTATERSTTSSGALAGVLIEAFRNSDEATPIASATTDGMGKYSLTIDTNGESLDGFLKATKSGFVTTYLFPPYPLMMDFSGASVIMVTSQNFEALSNIAQGGQQAGHGLIGLIITDGTNPVAGATASSSPASPTPTRYNSLVGSFVIPTAGASQTYTDGVAYLFDMTPGVVTVSAAKTGSTFTSHPVKVFADQLTTTVIVP